MKHGCFKRADLLSGASSQFSYGSSIDRLIQDGPHALRLWFEKRQENPCDGPPPSDYNGWSFVATRAKGAADQAIARSDFERTTAYAHVACQIYEQILPQMSREFEETGLAGLNFNLTEIEAVQIRVEVINQFGHHPDSLVASVDIIEEWFFRFHQHCCKESPLDEECSEFAFANQLKRAYAEKYFGVLRALDERYLTNRLRLLLDSRHR